MKIVFIEPFFHSETNSRSFDRGLIKGLLEHGNEVFLFSPEKTLPEIEDFFRKNSYFHFVSFPRFFSQNPFMYSLARCFSLLWLRFDVLNVSGRDFSWEYFLVRTFHPYIALTRRLSSKQISIKKMSSFWKKIFFHADVFFVEENEDKKKLPKHIRRRTIVLGREKRYTRKNRNMDIFSQYVLKEKSYILYRVEDLSDSKVLLQIIRAYEHLGKTNKITNNTPLVLIVEDGNESLQAYVDSLVMTQPMIKVIKELTEEDLSTLVFGALTYIVSDIVFSLQMARDAVGFGVPVIKMDKKRADLIVEKSCFQIDNSVEQLSGMLAYILNVPFQKIEEKLESGKKRMYRKHGHIPLLKKTLEIYREAIVNRRCTSMKFDITKKIHRYS
ncbi:MAG: hypothetical protein EOM19_03220 [Candidatus Moranbacteria bacterium]|nr:hypothetical protein [Candidatus Moranbacteria bacterium]